MKTVFFVVIPGCLLSFAALFAASYFQGGLDRLECIRIDVSLCKPAGYTLLEQTVGIIALVLGGILGHRLGVGRIEWPRL